MASAVRYASEAELRAALGPAFPLSTETFDGFEDGSLYHDQTPGVLASSFNDGLEGELPLQIRADSAPASPPNILFGGFIPGQPTPPQSLVFDFDPAVLAFAFNLTTKR